MKQSNYDEALRKAAYDGLLNRTKALLKLGANPNATDEEGQTALHSAVAWFQPFMSDMLWRVHHTDPEVLEALIEGGAKLNVQDKKGVTPLLLACRNGNTKAAEFLSQRGADVKLTDGYGWSALTWHLWTNRYFVRRTALGEHLRKRGAVLTLWEALLMEDSGQAERLVDRAQLSATGPFKLTQLHLAARAGMLRVTEQLLTKGADVRATDSNNTTPLHFAMGGYSSFSNSGMAWHRLGSQKDRERLVLLLLKAGAPLDIQASYYGFDPEDPGGTTPLEWAVGLQQVGLMRLLLKAGGNPNQPNQYGDPILMDAIDTKNAAVVKVLLEAGANPEARDTVWSAWEAAEKLPPIRRLLQEAIKKKNTPSPVIGRGGRG